MKPILLFCLLSGLIGNISCHKPFPPPQPRVYTGRVIHNVCGNIVIQFMDGTQLGQNGWTDMGDTTHIQYDHVFKVANPCTIGLAPGMSDTIQFKFVPVSVQNCALCKIYIPTPDTVYNIQAIYPTL